MLYLRASWKIDIVKWVLSLNKAFITPLKPLFRYFTCKLMPISEFTNIVTIPAGATGITITQTNRFCYLSKYTVESRYLELCVTRSVYLNQNCIFIAFSNHNLFALRVILTCRKSPIYFELSRFDCIYVYIHAELSLQLTLNVLKVRKIYFNHLYLCYFFTKFYVLQLLRIVSVKIGDTDEVVRQ